MKKPFNIWIYDKDGKGPTGPWKFGCAIMAKDEWEAIKTAKSRFGYDGKYRIYEGL